MVGGGPLPAGTAAQLNQLNPYAIANFEQAAGGLIPELALGAAAGQGASLVTPSRPLSPAEVLLTRDFLLGDTLDTLGAQQPASASIGGFTIHAAAARSKLPTNLNDWMTGALRLRQYAIDMGRWPVDAGYLTTYLPLIISFDKVYTWEAINKFDEAFRRSLASTQPGTITSWEEWPQRLFATIFELDLSSRRTAAGNSTLACESAPSPQASTL